jgi:hypothetical protein
MLHAENVGLFTFPQHRKLAHLDRTLELGHLISGCSC